MEDDAFERVYTGLIHLEYMLYIGFKQCVRHRNKPWLHLSAAIDWNLHFRAVKVHYVKKQ